MSWFKLCTACSYNSFEGQGEETRSLDLLWLFFCPRYTSRGEFVEELPQLHEARLGLACSSFALRDEAIVSSTSNLKYWNQRTLKDSSKEKKSALRVKMPKWQADRDWQSSLPDTSCSWRTTWIPKLSLLHWVSSSGLLWLDPRTRVAKTFGWG